MNTFGPFPLALAIDRARELAALKIVGTAADLRAAIATLPNAAPALYVLATERGQAPAGASGGTFVQKASAHLQLVLFVRNYSGTAGSGARAEADQLIAALREKFLNWAPSAEFEPLRFEASRDESFDGGWLITQEIYQTTFRIEVRP